MLAHAASGSCHADLKALVDAYAQGRISEEDLEGIHRTIKKEKMRALAALVPWAGTTQCYEQNMAIVNHVLNNEHDGRAIIASEWANYKRILQAPGGKRKCARPVKMKLKDFRKKLFRLQEYSLIDWSGVDPIVHEASRDRPSLIRVQAEYLRMSLAKGRYYSVNDDDGNEHIFQLVDFIAPSRKFIRTTDRSAPRAWMDVAVMMQPLEG